jgi:hypothetical protein
MLVDCSPPNNLRLSTVDRLKKFNLFSFRAPLLPKDGGTRERNIATISQPVSSPLSHGKKIFVKNFLSRAFDVATNIFWDVMAVWV